MLQSIPLGSISTDCGTQTRAGTQSDAVEDYSLIYHNDPDALPPLDVFLCDGKYLLVDGFHRHKSAKAAGLTHLKCNVHKGEFDDALKFALASNWTFGVRRTNADKRWAVEKAVKNWPKLSQRGVSEICGVGHHLVADVLRVLAANQANVPLSLNSNQISNSKPSGEKVTGGTTHEQVKNIKKSNKVPVDQQPAVLKKADSTAKPDKTIYRDETGSGDDPGTVIPEEAVPYWLRRQEVQDLMTKVSQVKTVVVKGMEGADSLYVGIWQGCLGHLESAYNELSHAKPYAVCTQCMGSPSLQPKGCPLCHGTGLISKFKWDTVSRREIIEIRRKSNILHRR